MANSLHINRKKAPIVEALFGLLKPGGRLILVEYNTDRGDASGPNPIVHPAWEALDGRCGFEATRMIGSCRNRFLGES